MAIGQCRMAMNMDNLNKRLGITIQGVSTAIWRRVESDTKVIQAISVQPTFHFCRLVTVGTSLIIDRVFFGEVSCFKLGLKKKVDL